MQIYGSLISPFVRKVCLVAEEKGIAYELVAIARSSTDPAFREASPFGKMPALRDGDYLLSDSTAIVAYLDALRPEPAVIPADPQARGRAIWFDEFADTILGGAGLKIMFNRFVSPKFLKIPGDEALAAKGEAELPEIFAYLEQAVPDAGWLLGSNISLADYAVASVLRTLAYCSAQPDEARYPRIAAWYARVRQRPAWQAIAAVEDKPR